MITWQFRWVRPSVMQVAKQFVLSFSFHSWEPIEHSTHAVRSRRLWFLAGCFSFSAPFCVFMGFTGGPMPPAVIGNWQNLWVQPQRGRISKFFTVRLDRCWQQPHRDTHLRMFLYSCSHSFLLACCTKPFLKAISTADTSLVNSNAIRLNPSKALAMSYGKHVELKVFRACADVTSPVDLWGLGGDMRGSSRLSVCTRKSQGMERETAYQDTRV